MLDWLRRDPGEVPQVAVGKRLLPLDIRRRDSARRLTMRLASDGQSVLVTMPRWARTAEALAFARSRADWLERQLTAIPAPLPLVDGAIIPFRGKHLRLCHDAAGARRVELSPECGELRLGGPEASLASRLTRWMKAEALTLFAEELNYYSSLAGKDMPALSLSSAQRRWGSCSARGGIRLNWRLIMAPDPVRRSVVAHEVAHLVHFNHSPQFRLFLNDLFEGDLAQADLWLKREGRSLYIPLG